MIGVYWPLKIRLFEKMTIIHFEHLPYAWEPCLRFCFKVKVSPRSNGTINDVFLKAITKNNNPVKIPLRLMTFEYSNVIEPAKEY